LKVLLKVASESLGILKIQVDKSAEIRHDLRERENENEREKLKRTERQSLRT
jgi:hypothetical protein